MPVADHLPGAKIRVDDQETRDFEENPYRTCGCQACQKRTSIESNIKRRTTRVTTIVTKTTLEGKCPTCGR